MILFDEIFRQFSNGVSLEIEGASWYVGNAAVVHKFAEIVYRVINNNMGTVKRVFFLILKKQDSRFKF